MKILLMRYLFLLIGMLFIPASLSAQTEFGGKSISIPAGSGISKPVSPALPAANSPSIFDPKPKPAGSIEVPPANTNFGKEPEFSNPNTSVTEKLNKVEYRDEDLRSGKRDQYLGEIRTKSTTITIRYRDTGEIDGDMVRVSINDDVVMPAIVLEGGFRSFDIILKQYSNRVEFMALNEGYDPPNTAEFEILDEKGNQLFNNSWNIATGYKATVNIFKG